MMEMRKPLLILSFLLIGQLIQGQHIKRSCGSEYWVDDKIETDPDVALYYGSSFRSFNENKSLRSNDFPGCRLIIPVHVIIVHPPGETVGEGANISFEHVQSQIYILNQDFGFYNSNAGDTPSQFAADDTGIQFCLASVDPDGNPTDGITRYATNDDFDFGVVGPVYDSRIAIKKATEWDRDHYLNIWVAPTIGDESDIIGFARVPVLTSHPDPDDDGINIKTSVFGGPGFGAEAPYNLGRTTTHEVGHYFGLNHIATKNNTCSGDDGILDTPRQFKQNHGCPTHPSPSCGNNGDMFMNYMDYTDDACMSAFTTDQGAYMREIIYQLRPGLIEEAHIACPEDVVIELSSLTINPTSCNRGNDGSFSFEACGGNNEEYTYTLDGSNSSQSAQFGNLDPGNHLLSVTNELGITLDTMIFIPQPDLVNVEFTEVTHITCFDADDGSFELVVSGGTIDDISDYTVSINGGGFSSQTTYSDLEPGTYIIIARDKNQCETQTSVEITSPSPLNIIETSNEDVSCFGTSTGSISVSGLGGTPGYEYSRNGSIFDVGNQFDQMPAGNVDLWVRDMNGCITSSSFVIAQPDPLVTEVVEIQEISCAGINDAAIQVNTAGGTGPYDVYLDGQIQSGSIINNLGAGTFSVRVEDSNQCEVTADITIENPPPLVIDSVTTVNVLCSGDLTGTITLYASGGSEPYTYFIDGVLDADGIFDGLSEDLYTISVQDAHECEIVSETVIITDGDLKVQEELKIIPTCSYSLDGSIEVSGSGGGGSYTYSIDGVNFQEESIFENLGVGIYNVRINDGDDCLASTIIDLRGPDPVGLESMDILPPSCFDSEDGMIDFEIVGGVGNYDYYLNGNYIEEDLVTGLKAGDYILEVLDGKGCRFETMVTLEAKNKIDISLIEIIPADCSTDELGMIEVSASGGSGLLTFSINDKRNTTGQFTDMSPGNYLVIVTDQEGCDESMIVEVPGIEGLELQIDDVRNESCVGIQDGSFTINVSGGKGIYSYSVDQTMVDSPNIQGLGAGVYEVYVSDSSSCSISGLVEILPAEPIVLDNVGGSSPSCNNSDDGTLRLNASGGEGNLVYAFEGRENTTGIFPGTSGGNYTITLTDNNLCQEEFEITIEAPDRLRADEIEILSPLCAGLEDGSIYLIAGGGTGIKTITYQGESFNSEIIVEDLPAGNYRFNLSDENNCTGRIDVFIDEPNPISITDTIVVNQNLRNRGSIEITASGGTRPYTYSLDGGSPTSTPFFEDLIEGHYDIEITDAQGCSETFTINVYYDDRFENPPGSISDVLVGYERIQNDAILSFIAHGEQRIKLYVFDAGGRFVMYTEEFKLDGPNTMIIPAQNFPAGIYIVRIDALRESEYLKFVKF